MDPADRRIDIVSPKIRFSTPEVVDAKVVDFCGRKKLRDFRSHSLLLKNNLYVRFYLFAIVSGDPEQCIFVSLNQIGMRSEECSDSAAGARNTL